MQFTYRSILLLLLVAVTVPSPADEPTQGTPSNEKAQKIYKQALEHLEKHEYQSALDGFRKADKIEEGHCGECQKRIIECAIHLHDWKAADAAALQLLNAAETSRGRALGHYRIGAIALDAAIDKNWEEYFERAHSEFSKALDEVSNFPDAVFGDGRALAYLHQDDKAKARFEQYSKMPAAPEVDRQRALRYIAQPDLARSKMAPPFSVTTSDGKVLSLDDLKGKVLLIDFWATWCGPCREALPHVRDIANKFRDDPFVVLSVSLDDDAKKWKEFVQKNEMTWPQYRDPDGFRGDMAQMFSVNAIPHTFTIDADGLLEDEHIGEAAIEGKLKKLIAHAREVQAAAAATRPPS